VKVWSGILFPALLRRKPQDLFSLQSAYFIPRNNILDDTKTDICPFADTFTTARIKSTANTERCISPSEETYTYRSSWKCKSEILDFRAKELFNRRHRQKKSFLEFREFDGPIFPVEPAPPHPRRRQQHLSMRLARSAGDSPGSFHGRTRGMGVEIVNRRITFFQDRYSFFPFLSKICEARL